MLHFSDVVTQGNRSRLTLHNSLSQSVLHFCHLLPICQTSLLHHAGCLHCTNVRGNRLPYTTSEVLQVVHIEKKFFHWCWISTNSKCSCCKQRWVFNIYINSACRNNEKISSSYFSYNIYSEQFILCLHWR